MASWRDGPEYAPLERPGAFVSPAVDPLAPSPPPPPAPAGIPGEEPAFSPPPGELPDLAALVPFAAPGRNPHLPFEVATATVTSGGGWSAGPDSVGSTGSRRSPEQPFNDPGPSLTGYLPVQQPLQPAAQVNPATFPAPGTPQWFAPPPESRVPAAPPPVTVGQIWRAATPGVLIPLVIGALFGWLSIFMIAISFALSARIAYRREAVRRSYLVALILLGTLGAFSVMTDGFDSDLMFASLSGGAQIACAILPVVVGLIVGAALRAGERPDRIG